MSLADRMVQAGSQLVLKFSGTRVVAGCRVFTHYEVYDGRGTLVYDWKSDVKAPGIAGPIESSRPIPLIQQATPGTGHVDISVSYVKNSVQAVLYSTFGWSASLPPYEIEFTILPPEPVS